MTRWFQVLVSVLIVNATVPAQSASADWHSLERALALAEDASKPIAVYVEDSY